MGNLVVGKVATISSTAAPAFDQKRGVSFLEVEKSVDQGSRLLTFSWRRPIHIADIDGREV